MHPRRGKPFLPAEFFSGLLMSEHELQRIEVLSQVLDGSLRTATAAQVLGLSQRQVQRLICEVQADGAMAVRHNLRFAQAPLQPKKLHRPVNLPASRLADILCVRDQRQVSVSLVVHYERRKFILDDSEHARSAIGRYVETYAWPNRPFEIRWKGLSLPYRIFDSAQQRVTHTAITENKRLGDVLAFIKTQQDVDPPQVGQRSLYTPTGKPGRGKTGWVERRAERRAAAAQIFASPPAE